MFRKIKETINSFKRRQDKNGAIEMIEGALRQYDLIVNGSVRVSKEWLEILFEKLK